MRKNNKNFQEPRFTGFDWNDKIFKLELLDYAGFPSTESFMHDLISRDTFVLCVANCKIKHNTLNNSRRAASKLRQIFNNNL